jgi:hypothetical protein
MASPHQSLTCQLAECATVTSSWCGLSFEQPEGRNMAGPPQFGAEPRDGIGQFLCRVILLLNNRVVIGITISRV